MASFQCKHQQLARAFSLMLVIIFAAHSDAACDRDCCKPGSLTCCTPGTLQDGDPPKAEKGSFCTNKPFEEEYLIRIGKRVPMQLNLVDYCTDEPFYTSYFAPEVDKFSLVNFPCTYQPVPCAQMPEAQREKCEEGKKVWEEIGCSSNEDGSSFFKQFVEPRICNEVNFPEKNNRGYTWIPPDEGDPFTPPSQAKCNCNWDLMKNKTGQDTITTGVPDGFIKEGMSTFYVQVVIGGRSTSANDDPECQCSGPTDLSPACMCALGTRKVPYVYNNSVIPYLTALVSMKNGQLIYKKTYIKYNFEANGIGCVGCGIDYCWGWPQDELAGWGYTGYESEHKMNLMCAVPLAPNPDPELQDNEPFCNYPQGTKEIEVCSLKIYVAWVGTDGYGRACMSSNEMFSKFTQMGVSNVAVDFYNGVSNLATTVDRRITGRDGA
eukprot:CAMPEP_0181314494 /NCGR_PEP_ID=MMETSP1101-20121128/14850_1 /TAXON_ID=46948 /ORGANISM="Rhodomonas abbreviata, Strain Caron Lab Isolate" /LENGTH=434 /DNA_ID=CAMNT_0023421595 /DNA_START=220 /DNA_END=1524 /DNA_ORIENTATION=-